MNFDRSRVARLTMGVGLLALVLAAPVGAQPKDEPEAPATGSTPGSTASEGAGGAAAHAATGSTPASEPETAPPEKPTPLVVEAAEVPGNGVDRLDPTAPLEETNKIRIFRQAEKRMDAIKRAQEELRHREARVAKAQADLDRRYKSLRAIQDEMSKGQSTRDKAREAEQKVALEEKKVAAEQAKVEGDKEAEKRKEATERLSAVFEKMKPSEIAKVVPEMDEELVVEILDRLKEKTTAKVLGTVPPPLAARLSEKIARLKKKQQAEARESKQK